MSIKSLHELCVMNKRMGWGAWHTGYGTLAMAQMRFDVEETVPEQSKELEKRKGRWGGGFK